MSMRWMYKGILLLALHVASTVAFGQKEFKDAGSLLDLTGELTYSLSNGYSDIRRDTNRFSPQVPSLVEKLKHEIWVKGSFVNRTGESVILGVKNATIDSLVLYLGEGTSMQRYYATGDQLPYASRMRDSEYFLFDLPPTTATQPFYLKVKVKELTQIPVWLGNATAWETTAHRADIGVAIFFGGILILVIYNLFIYIATKEVNYVIYAAANMTALLLILTLDGYSFRYFWPQLPRLNDMVPTMAAANSFIYCIFFISFTNLKHYEPRWRPFFIGMLGLFLLIILLNILFPGFLASVLYEVAAIPYIFIQLYVVYRVIQKGYTPAKYFLWGSCLYSTGGFLFIVYNLNILPVEFQVGIALKISLLLEACLLSFALADKLNFLKNENIRITNESNLSLTISNARLKEALESLDLFIYRSAHDIRGPLMRLKGLVSLFSSDTPPDHEYLDKLRGTADNLESILDKHIVLNSLKSYRLNVESVSLEEVVKKALRQLSLDGSVVVRAEPGLTIQTDGHLLLIILKELFQNGKLFQSGREDFFLGFEVMQEGGQLVMRVSDHGPGIDPSSQGRIFEMFFRGSALSQGSGVGLSIASEAARKLGGSLVLKESRHGLTVFELCLGSI